MQLVAISWMVLDLVVAAGGGSSLEFRGWIISSGFGIFSEFSDLTAQPSYVVLFVVR
jgi:hypothetical protein